MRCGQSHHIISLLIYMLAASLICSWHCLHQLHLCCLSLCHLQNVNIKWQCKGEWCCAATFSWKVVDVVSSGFAGYSAKTKTMSCGVSSVSLLCTPPPSTYCTSYAQLELTEHVLLLFSGGRTSMVSVIPDETSASTLPWANKPSILWWYILLIFTVKGCSFEIFAGVNKAK